MLRRRRRSRHRRHRSEGQPLTGQPVNAAGEQGDFAASVPTAATEIPQSVPQNDAMPPSPVSQPSVPQVPGHGGQQGTHPQERRDNHRRRDHRRHRHDRHGYDRQQPTEHVSGEQGVAAPFQRQPQQQKQPQKPRVPEEKLLLISHESGETSVALVENKVVQEFYIERKSASKVYGNIYKGKVKAVVPGINAIFVDIGFGKDGFLYLHDVDRSDDDDVVFVDEDVRPGGKPKAEQSITQVREGDEVIVQVTKEAISTKGPRLTTKLSIPGRFMVLTSESGQVGISKRIDDRSERDRIRELLREIELPKDIGFIVRTAAEGKDKKDLSRDAKYLLQVWSDIQKKKKSGRAPICIHEELGLVERVIRDTFTEDMSQIVTDSPEIFKNIHKFIKMYIPQLKLKLVLYKDKVPLFTKYKINNDIESTYTRKVALKSGGSIIVEQTEGLIAIDVNSGKFKDRKDAEMTSFKTNLEAAREVVRQLRLRDLGGIIVIDFIDMYDQAHKKELMRLLNEEVKRDKARINILKISEIGVVEMTRQRLRASKESSVFDDCPYCKGRGIVKSLTTMRIQAMKDIRQKAASVKQKDIIVTLNPDVAEDLMQLNAEQIKAIEKESRNRIIVVADASMHREEIALSY